MSYKFKAGSINWTNAFKLYSGKNYGGKTWRWRKDLETDFGRVMREQSESLIVISNGAHGQSKDNMPKKHWANTTYDDRRALQLTDQRNIE